ncbi:hypothetical protein [Leptolyngbya sp. NIES-2104]|uniref:hypothetical protein n=1 Tax=Leptolyngbya sp. NIES-2104 TaxID=1552121 RepID=UPI0006EC5F4D|nr:hypothetical protein [Leptolyngbya sp. NIES-2104]GAP99242.1 hypothetical protein NIES2104_58030 [Leptolyngbya sp. NIES-2104]
MGAKTISLAELIPLDPVRLAFAWTQSAQVPLILGQTNFFREFEICFERSRQTIEITRY